MNKSDISRIYREYDLVKKAYSDPIILTLAPYIMTREMTIAVNDYIRINKNYAKNRF